MTYTTLNTDQTPMWDFQSDEAGTKFQLYIEEYVAIWHSEIEAPQLATYY